MAKEQIQEKDLSVQEVADLLALSKNTIYAMAKRGELKSYRIGNKMRFPREDINGYLAKSRHEVPTSAVKQIKVESSLLNGETEADTGLIISGQDVLLDVLTNFMNMKRVKTSRTYMGSFESILALYQGRCHAATAHLWDWIHDDYNVEYVRWLMPATGAVIVNLSYRYQGIYVQKGNPKGICGIEDLARADVKLLNRRTGSGSRILLDGKLKQLGIRPQEINGYEEEVGSHLTLASKIASGEADAGIGTERVTRGRAGLDFIPIQRERYDMVIRKDSLERPDVAKLLSVLRSEEYLYEIACISGNDYTDTGKIMAEV